MGSADEEREDGDGEVHRLYVVAMLLFVDYAATVCVYGGQC